ncbi:hypothetical protein SprV_0200636500 [Sparganum proliferum]
MIEGHDSAVYETPTTSMAEGRARVRKSRLVSMSGSVDQIGNHRHVKRSSDYKRIKRHIRSPAVIEYCQERRIIARQRNCICGEPMRQYVQRTYERNVRKRLHRLSQQPRPTATEGQSTTYIALSFSLRYADARALTMTKDF